MQQGNGNGNPQVAELRFLWTTQVSEFNVEYRRSADNTFVAYGQECGRSRLRRFKLFAIPRESLAVSPLVTYFLLYYVRTRMARHGRRKVVLRVAADAPTERSPVTGHWSPVLQEKPHIRTTFYYYL